jgi:hypothetical protein
MEPLKSERIVPQCRNAKVCERPAGSNKIAAIAKPASKNARPFGFHLAYGFAELDTPQWHAT